MALFFQAFSGKNRQKLTKNAQFSSKMDKKLSKSGRRISDFPKKKCHLIWKIATFFENFDPPFSEKLTSSTRSTKKDHVPN